jgi:transitional endoplasmic reticulum ATPase
MAATNRKDLIDPAFLREGRIGTHVEIGLPSPDEYSAIVSIHLGGTPRSEFLDLGSAVGALPSGMSGADLAGIGRKIRELAVMRHLDDSPDGGTEGFSIEQSDVLQACGIVSESDSGEIETIQIEPLD